MKYIYTAVFTFEDGTVYARIPDLPGCITTGRDLSDAIMQITDAANGWLATAEDEGLEINQPTPQNNVERPEGAAVSFIEIDTIAYREKTETRSVRKNVSMPAWMAKMADRLDINCSKVLQDALRAEFESGGTVQSL